MESATVSAHIDGQLYAALKKHADEQERSVSWIVGKALQDYMRLRSFDARLKGGPSSLAGNQLDLEDAIVAAVKRGPVKSPKRK